MHEAALYAGDRPQRLRFKARRSGIEANSEAGKVPCACFDGRLCAFQASREHSFGILTAILAPGLPLIGPCGEVVQGAGRCVILIT